MKAEPIAKTPWLVYDGDSWTFDYQGIWLCPKRLIRIFGKRLQKITSYGSKIRLLAFKHPANNRICIYLDKMGRWGTFLGGRAILYPSLWRITTKLCKDGFHKVYVEFQTKVSNV